MSEWVWTVVLDSNESKQTNEKLDERKNADGRTDRDGQRTLATIWSVQQNGSLNCIHSFIHLSSTLFFHMPPIHRPTQADGQTDTSTHFERDQTTMEWREAEPEPVSSDESSSSFVFLHSIWRRDEVSFSNFNSGLDDPSILTMLRLMRLRTPTKSKPSECGVLVRLEVHLASSSSNRSLICEPLEMLSSGGQADEMAGWPFCVHIFYFIYLYRAWEIIKTCWTDIYPHSFLFFSSSSSTRKSIHPTSQLAS